MLQHLSPASNLIEFKNFIFEMSNSKDRKIACPWQRLSAHSHITPNVTYSQMNNIIPLILCDFTCNTDSKYIISRSDTIAPFITMISSPLIIPKHKHHFIKMSVKKLNNISLKNMLSHYLTLLYFCLCTGLPQQEKNVTPTCTTEKDSRDPGAECIFPFKFKGLSLFTSTIY